MKDVLKTFGIVVAALFLYDIVKKWFLADLLNNFDGENLDIE